MAYLRVLSETGSLRRWQPFGQQQHLACSSTTSPFFAPIGPPPPAPPYLLQACLSAFRACFL